MPDRETPAVRVIAHRGASHARPENTLVAFEHAIELGVDLIEYDVRLTHDGQTVIMHDKTVDRTTSGEGAVSDLTLEQILSFDASVGHEGYAGTRVPTLDEVCTLVAPTTVGMNVQIYADDDDRGSLTMAVTNALQRHGFDNRTFIASDEKTVLMARRLDPARPICNLDGQGRREIESLDTWAEQGIHIAQPYNNVITPEYVAKAHELGIVCNVFYADDVDGMNYLIECGVDGILTNEPELLLQVLGRR
jgi:glycerophosphoryl diester phosphodiesterase